MEVGFPLPGKLNLALFLQLLGFACFVFADPYLRTRQRRILLAVAALAFSLPVLEHLRFYLELKQTAPALRTAVSLYGFCACAAALVLTGVLIRDTLRVCAERKGTALLVFPALLIIGAVTADRLRPGHGPVSWLTVATIGCCCLSYLWMHLQLAREHDRALVSEQRIQIMISQIQPHFLYNTLSAIQALCRIDPEKAFETTEKFGSYLRMNIESLSEKNLIPFQKELEHTKIYADIEMMRFPYFHISYDIREDDFEVPALSVQPIVENAIRHGIRGQYNGRVRVMTTADEGDYVITVTDNGRGFHPETLEEMTGTHIGIRNVRERIEVLCGGTLRIESDIGKGTTVTIRIPRGEEKL